MSLIYHYCPLETFYLIVDNDSFWASHIRFSNDISEYKHGLDMINLCNDNNLFGEGKISINEEMYLEDCFIVCFCEIPDLLSQWRGYAEGGVCIGFDFNRAKQDYLLLSKKKEKDDPEKDSELLSKIDSPKPLIYCKEDIMKTAKSKLKAEEKRYRDKLDKAIEDINGSTCKYNAVFSLIPYLKHYNFIEEKEYRLIISLNDIEKVRRAVFYKDEDSCKKPLIEIKFTYTSETDNKIFIGNDISNPNNRGIKKKFCNSITGIVERKYSGRTNIGDPGLIPHNNEILIGSNKSQKDNQKDIFYDIKKAINEHNRNDKIKIWCDGHLPIREIIVGPRVDQDRVFDSIRYYIKQFYWLDDVVVRKSDTPYKCKT